MGGSGSSALVRARRGLEGVVAADLGRPPGDADDAVLRGRRALDAARHDRDIALYLYAEARWQAQPLELARLTEGSFIARSLGLRVNAGHGLTYQNVEPVAAIEGMEELNIGHTIVARALAVGLETAVRQMKALVQNPRRDPLFGSTTP
jgi:pyridoxine 5'-phosphate synthase PdxJ